MAKTETLEEFYQHKFDWLPDNLRQDIGHVNVFRLEDCVGLGKVPVQYSRRDFFKISLIRGQYVYHYADKSIEINGSTLMFFNPQVPYTWESVAEETTGFFCIFREAFFTERIRGNLNELPVFATSNHPAYPLNAQQDNEVSELFEKMLADLDSEYPFRYDSVCNRVSELIHYALKLQPAETLHDHPDAKSRITAVFSELLERQFPIESPTQRFKLRSAGDFARHLSVHVNYLNRAIRDTTGRTTTDQIARRLAAEAQALLKHTDWNIAEIGYGLGFDEPAHFNYFFKKQTGLTPSAYRKV
ncbi:helix-turn-helix domain-containing protein [Spirosoma utsteinense]|uniref:AraC-like DNA-binding protein n=1 Tax=Spirosoma utsteinense TaxID=2585773 RepID=A0ABR6WDM0_9BACT|nr:AraC family transcriptional regulator [Spirosoma utsteinense]MBC3788689.1 AraC-like DNA-binding protein [Spirosoma utsteinense]MBC3794619.1 AraC-like DNA-binding protein [Spirosoma utsteinense]